MEVYRAFLFEFLMSKNVPFFCWCFMPALTDTMPGLLKHPTAAYANDILLDECMTWGEPERVHVQKMEWLHAHQNVRTSGHRI